MIPLRLQDTGSVLFITLDSCRYDTFSASKARNLKSVGPLHRAMAPGNFTYGSHAAMFVGFTPGVAMKSTAFLNPKYAKIFKMLSGGFPGIAPARFNLDGPNIVAGFRRAGYATIGTGGVRWFDPSTETGRLLTSDFEAYYYPGDSCSIDAQVAWIADRLAETAAPAFVFLNVGETHVPYYHAGAPWSPESNPCIPFHDGNDAGECRRRQRGCLEYVDAALEPLLAAFRSATTLVTADHGDCWGEDGLWEHGVHHRKVFEVPLVFRIADAPERR
jgi:hypothetical protein